MRKETAVAIPVRNEEKRIRACLAALSRQSICADHLILLLNNCTDGTAAAIRSSPQGARRLYTIQCMLPGSRASAGAARSMAMNYAAALLNDGVILTTDADAEVPENWVESNLMAIDAGADAVCGMAVIDPFEALMIPDHLHQDDAREVAYGRLLDEMNSMILPDVADPWPRHTENSGASIAVSALILRRAGGMPCVPSGEDRALLGLLRRMDARVRHDPSVRVIVSGRLEGRAQGGMADTIRRRMVQQDEFTDETLEPAFAAFNRIRLKRRFQALRQDPGKFDLRLLARLLGISKTGLDEAVDEAHFGMGWHLIEELSPALVKRRVRFRELPGETGIARRLLSKLRSEHHYERRSAVLALP